MIHIVTIAGSARPGNYTNKALQVAIDELNRHDNITMTQINPAELRLAIPGTTMDSSDRGWLIETVKSADGVILATPEYHGTFSSLMKLTIENMGYPSALKDKPVSLLGVAAGRIGAIKSLEHLRSVASHIGALVLPDPISIAHVRDRFDKDGRVLDDVTEKAIRDLANDLLDYIRATICPDLSTEQRVRAATE